MQAGTSCSLQQQHGCHDSSFFFYSTHLALDLGGRAHRTERRKTKLKANTTDVRNLNAITVLPGSYSTQNCVLVA